MSKVSAPNRKRKAAPTVQTGHQQFSGRQRKRVKTQDARSIAVQTTGGAYSNGEIDVEKFVRAREFEIRALESGISRARQTLTARAFQNVPRELRRRTASHNAKRVPKRLRARARKEMREDNTPVVDRRKRKPNAKLRLRLEKRKELARPRLARTRLKDKELKVLKQISDQLGKTGGRKSKVATREPRVKKGVLQKPAKPKARFRKRQIHKTWLPTHLYHAKRAHMTPPKEPLWRMAIPLSPTVKSYRPTHRASSLRGAIAWDMSYMSTIGLDGVEHSLQSLLVGLGVGKDEDASFWDRSGRPWIKGERTWRGWVYNRDCWPCSSIAPITAFWQKTEAQTMADARGSGETDESTSQGAAKPPHKIKRKLLIRVHPAAFLELWKEILNLAKMQRPQVMVEDLRFEIGSIQVTGPAAAEAILNVLRPRGEDEQTKADGLCMSGFLRQLKGVTNSASLPRNAMLGFDAADPRLQRGVRGKTPCHHPDISIETLQMIASWPVKDVQDRQRLFDRSARLSASRQLPSQHTINRRRSSAGPGNAIRSLPTDPAIPVILYTESVDGISQGSWTALLPWKCVLPVWYCLMYQPISSGCIVKLGGLEQIRQIAFESGQTWFPGDESGTAAGKEWEAKESSRRRTEWERKPPKVRVAFESLDLGGDQRGELGQGWSCDWARLLSKDGYAQCHRIPTQLALKMLRQQRSVPETSAGDRIDYGLASVKLTLLARGTAKTCARVYRLPRSNSALLEQWLRLLPPPTTRSSQHQRQPSSASAQKSQSTALHRRRWLAARTARSEQAHLPDPRDGQPKAGQAGYPVAPDEADLIGFVTSGNFNLAEGKSTAIGSIWLSKTLELRAKLDRAPARDEGMGGPGLHPRQLEHFCIVRDAGQSLARLAKWELTC